MEGEQGGRHAVRGASTRSPNSSCRCLQHDVRADVVSLPALVLRLLHLVEVTRPFPSEHSRHPLWRCVAAAAR